MEKKIYIKEEDNLDDVIQKIKHSKSDNIILHIPEDSNLSSSLDNFHAIKRESIIEDIDLSIESVDSFILELASLAKIKAINPFFGEEEKVFSDILPKHTNQRNAEEVEESNDEESESSKYDFLRSAPKKNNNFKMPKKTNVLVRSTRFKLVLVALFLLMSTSAFAAYRVLPQATVELELKETIINAEESINISVDGVENNDFDISLPGEIVTSRKNVEMRFPASSSDNVSQKATGEIWVYNNLTTESVPLIASTRFRAPDGKIYRVEDRVTIPGMNNSEESRVRVRVVADDVGGEYNREFNANERWTVPGFQESGLGDYYEGIYAIPAGPFTNGFVGETALATEEDIEKAREDIQKALFNSLSIEMNLISSNNLEVLEDSREFSVASESVDRIGDDNGEFSVFMEAEMRVFAIKKEALEEAIINKYLPPAESRQNEFSQDFIIIESSLTKEDVSIDWENGQISFQISGTVTIKPKIEEGVLYERLLGKTESDLRATLFNVPDLSRAKISFWPFWVNNVPERDSKLEIIID